MRRTQLHWLIVGVVPVLIINYLLWVGKQISFSYANISTYIGVHISYLFLLLLPIILSNLAHDPDFEDGIAAICAAHFLLQLILCFFEFIIPWNNFHFTISCLIVCYLLFIILLSINIIYVFKEESGYATKRETAALLLCIHIIDEIQSQNMLHFSNELMFIQTQLKQAINQEIDIIHGYDSAIVQQCRELQQSMITEDEDKVNFHLAILGQLLTMWQVGQEDKHGI